MSVLDLEAKFSLNDSEYTEGLKKAEESAKSGLGSALKTAGKVGAAAIGAATAAVAALTKQSVEGYSEFEQLEGGIETLFGQSAPKVMQDAAEAFSTAGMSANQYMDSAIQSAASLINSLGGDTEKAAELMNTSIVDMSDNVNKMGTSMEAVQNAYRGFSRGNFTMLDNLALGYAGTAEGMQQLLDKANEINASQGVFTQYSIDSYADIVQAIHVVQDEMGIANATQQEAMTTIQGSLSATKAAWENMIVGFARGDANISELITNLVDSASTSIELIVPRAIEAINGISQFIEEIAPVIGETLTTILTDSLPGMVDSAVSLIQSLTQAILDSLPSIIDAGIQIVSSLVSGLTTALPMIIEAVTVLITEISGHLTGESIASILQAGLGLIKALADSMLQNMPAVLEAIKGIITSVLEYLSGDGISDILQMGFDLIMSLAEGFMSNLDATIDAITEIIDAVIGFLTGDGLPMLLEMGLQLIMSMITGFVEKLPDVVNSITEIIHAVVDFLAGDGLLNLLSMGVELIFALAQGILENLPAVISSLSTLLADSIAYILENLPQFIASGIQLVGQIIVGLIEAIPDIIAALPEIFMAIIDAFAEVDWLSVGSNIIDGIVNGIGEAVSNLWDAAVNAAKTALAKIKNVLGIASPSRVFRDQVGKMIPEGMAIGIEANTDSVEDAMADIADLTTDPFAGMSNIVKFPEQGKGGQTYGGIVLNVYASDGMDVEEFADYTIEKLNQELEREGRALA